MNFEDPNGEAVRPIVMNVWLEGIWNPTVELGEIDFAMSGRIKEEEDKLEEEDECGDDTWQTWRRVKEGDMALIPCWNGATEAIEGTQSKLVYSWESLNI